MEKTTGVVSHSSLADLQTFSIPDNICPDAMHGIFEGCAQYELKLILQHFIFKNQDVNLSLAEFNTRSELFRYGVDIRNKLQSLSSEKLLSKQNKLGMNASQAWCFARNICLLVGDLVPENSQYMEMVHLLLVVLLKT
jgi:hypothetical protein